MRRQIRHIYHGQQVTEGAGVTLRRMFSSREAALFDPFLMLDDFRSDHPQEYIKGFPWHPHRGIETITYVLKGDVEHGDSLGNSGVISAGDVQWMTAGSGIIHQEMPKGDETGAMHGFQLWANLPASRKMMPPRYRGITAGEIPEARTPEANIKVIAGKVGDVAGPVDDVVIDPQYLDCAIAPGMEFVHQAPLGHTAFVFIHGGEGTISGSPVANGDLVLFGDGDELAATAGQTALKLLLMSGRPLREPIAWGGPIVMNTQDELDLAFRELRDKTFIKHRT
jgi:redox-sensitive bicupin YhaK (pirin superfamily)